MNIYRTAVFLLLFIGNTLYPSDPEPISQGQQQWNAVQQPYQEENEVDEAPFNQATHDALIDQLKVIMLALLKL